MVRAGSGGRAGETGPREESVTVRILDLWSQKSDAMLLLLQSICSKL